MLSNKFQISDFDKKFLALLIEGLDPLVPASTCTMSIFD